MSIAVDKYPQTNAAKIPHECFFLSKWKMLHKQRIIFLFVQECKNITFVTHHFVTFKVQNLNAFKNVLKGPLIYEQYHIVI